MGKSSGGRKCERSKIGQQRERVALDSRNPGGTHPTNDERRTAETRRKTEQTEGGNGDTAGSTANSEEKRTRKRGGGMVIENDGSKTDSQRARKQRRTRETEELPDQSRQARIYMENAQRGESLRKLSSAVGKRWTAIEEGWDKATTQLTNELSARELEIPLSTAEAMLKQTMKTAKRMARGLPGQSTVMTETMRTTNAAGKKLRTSSSGAEKRVKEKAWQDSTRCA